jgi:hypothetical protein
LKNKGSESKFNNSIELLVDAKKDLEFSFEIATIVK